MAIRCMVSRTSLGVLLKSEVTPLSATSLRCFSSGSGRILSEEERAAENIWAKKREKEVTDKLKLRIQKEEAEKEKADQKAGGDAAANKDKE